MMHRKLFWCNQPVLIVDSDSIYSDEIEEGNPVYPAVVKEETYWYHTEWHVNI